MRRRYNTHFEITTLYLLLVPLFVLFLGLKLAKFITWSWCWIFSPFWIPALFVMIVITIIGVLWGLWIIIKFIKK